MKCPNDYERLNQLFIKQALVEASPPLIVVNSGAQNCDRS
jgi:hypothetical protein